ncbi:hypothetical protein [Kribbella swartbergensis]
MRAYRAAWLGFCGIVGVIGAAVAFTWSLSVIVLLFAFAALTGGVAALVALTPDDDSPLDRAGRRSVVNCAALAGAGAVSFVGLGTLLGAPMAMLVLILTIGSSPYVAPRWIGRLTDHGQLPSPANPGERNPVPAAEPTTRELELTVEPEVEVAELSDDALCLAWRTSFSALQRANSPAERLLVVEERCRYLDELARRNPPGVAAWLASGARAAGNPARFVLGDVASGRPPINWDALIQETDR